MFNKNLKSMKKILFILIIIPFFGFGQNVDWNHDGLKFDSILSFNGNIDSISNNMLFINHRINIEEISDKTEFLCQMMQWCDFDDHFGRSIRMIITFEIGLYDKLLNEYYRIMKNKISEKDFFLIRDSQRNWLKSRDNTVEYIYSTQKTGWFMYDDFTLLNMYKNRVSELLYMFDIHLDHQENSNNDSNEKNKKIKISNKEEKTNWDDH